MTGFTAPMLKANLASSPSAFTTRSVTPRISEIEENVDVIGVRLFMHAFDERQTGTPFRSSRFTIQPGCGTKEDRHAVKEIWFLANGDLDVCYDGAWHRVAAGNAIFFESWQPHFASNNGSSIAEIFSVWWA